LQRGKAEIGANLRYVSAIAVKVRSVKFDEIELVDREHDVPDAEERADQRMPAGLDDDALARIDQHQREIDGRGAGRHVAGVLLVPRGVGDDERAPLGREKAIGEIDGDALLALIFKPVEQQR
jgi:hypothetical protein